MGKGCQRVGQLLPDTGPEWMGICHHEQGTGLSSKLGFIIIFTRGSRTIVCTLCRYRLILCCVNTNETLVCRLKINHAWSAPSSCVYFLGTILMVATQEVNTYSKTKSTICSDIVDGLFPHDFQIDCHCHDCWN